MVYSESGLKVENHRHHERDRHDRCSQSKTSFYLHFGKILRHRVDCWFSCHNKGEPRPKRCLMSVYNEIATAFSFAVPHTIVATEQGNTVSVAVFLLPFESTRTETVVRWIRWDCHRHSVSADARRPGWIDLILKTTTNSRQTSHISYIHNYYTYTTLQTKFTCIPLTKKIHKTNAQISTAISSAAAVTVKSLCKLALDGAFVRTNIYKLYLLHSHVRIDLTTYK